MEASALQAPLGVAKISLNGTLLRLRSDEQLLALFRAGNDEAYRVIHDRYRQRLFSYMRQMLGGSRPDAEDALQDVFLRAYSALRADDRPIALRAWLYRVAHNRCIDQLRRPAPAPADVYDVSRAPLADPLEEAERRDDLRRLVADVRRLPPPQRSALLMRELEGLSYVELAEAHEATVPAIKSLLVRARVGLVQAAEARDTTCHEIRADLALAHGRGVRANGRARRHMRDCQGCREYRQGLRQVQRSFGALAPAAGVGAGLLGKLGLGGSGSAAAGGGAAGGTGLIGGGAATVTAGKVCAVVCSVALTAGGAVEVQHEIAGDGSPAARSAPAPVPRPAPQAATGAAAAGARAQPALPAAKAKAPVAKVQPPPAPATPVPAAPDTTPAAGDPTSVDGAATGGAQAPAGLADDSPPSDPAPDKPKASGAGGDSVTAPAPPAATGRHPLPLAGDGSAAPPHPS